MSSSTPSAKRIRAMPYVAPAGLDARAPNRTRSSAVCVTRTSTGSSSWCSRRSSTPPRCRSTPSMPPRRGRRKGLAGLTSTRSSPKKRSTPFGVPVDAKLVAPTEQVHIDQQRATAHDLQQLAGLTPRTGIPAQTPPSAAPLRECADTAVTAAIHKTDHRSPRDKPSSRYGGGLCGRHYRAARSPVTRQRARGRGL